MTQALRLTFQPEQPSSERETPRRVSAFDLVASQPWAIAPAMLEVISAIARRENDSPEAVEARLGRPLQNTRQVSMRGDVAVVPVTGPVFRYANLFTEISGATSLEVLAKDFTAALDDPKVATIVLSIDSPGGQANGIAEFAQMVRAAPKPVIAYVDGMAASAAYWIAAAAREIVVSKTAEVGSIGAVLAYDLGKKSAGQGEIVSSQSPKKRPDLSTEEGKSQIQARIDALAQVFIEDVAAYRGVSVETVLADFGQGDMRMGAAAVSIGMADRVATFEEILAGMNGDQAMPAKHPPMKGKATMTLEELRAAHPELCAALIEEGRAAGLKDGAAAECSRIKDVQAQSMPGHENLIAALMFDGKTTGPEAAVQVLSAERTVLQSRASALASEAPKPVPHAAVPEGAASAADDSLPIEERAKADWDKNTTLRAEFGGNFANYMAWAKANDAGRVRVLKK